MKRKYLIIGILCFLFGCENPKREDRMMKTPAIFENDTLPKRHLGFEEKSFNFNFNVEYFFKNQPITKNIENSFETGKDNIFFDFCIKHKSHKNYVLRGKEPEHIDTPHFSFYDFLSGYVTQKVKSNFFSECKYDIWLAYFLFGSFSDKPEVFENEQINNVYVYQLFFHLAIQKIKKNPKKYFQNHKKYLYDYISKENYQKYFAFRHKQLLETYSFFQKNNYKDVFLKMSKIDGLDVRQYIFNHELYEKEKKERGDILKDIYQSSDWQYSFWYRRYLEGNMEAVHGILQELKNHYEK